MPSCDDCGVVLDSIHDLQRQIKSWCPENETLKRKRDDTEDNEDGIKKTKWIEYESESENSDQDDSEDTVDENEGHKGLLNDAIHAAKTRFDEKYDKCVEEGMDENEACQQSNDDISRFVQKEFHKRYTTYLELAIDLEKNNIHEQIVHKIQSLIDDDVNQDKAIKRILRKSRVYFEDLFNDDIFEINDKSKETSDEEDSEDDE